MRGTGAVISCLVGRRRQATSSSPPPRWPTWTGDGLPDVIAGSKDHRLYAWNGRAQPISGFPIDLGAYVFSSPWVGDLDENGQADIVVGANNGLHVLRDVAPLGKVAWPKFHSDNSNTGWAGDEK